MKKEKENKLKSFLPDLKSQFKTKKYRPKAEIFEEVRGFKTYNEWLIKEAKKGDCIYLLGTPKIVHDKFEAFLMEINRKRIKKGIKMKVIYNHDAKETGRKREKMNLTEVRYSDPKLETPSWFSILNNTVTTIDVHETPFCFLLKNKNSAKSYMNYFSYMWKQAEKR